MNIVDQIRSKFQALAPAMNERVTRLWAAAEARALGRGGTAIVTRATGILKQRIRAGMRDLDALELEIPPAPTREQRIRRPGGGRKSLEELDPGVVAALEALIEPLTRGDPQSPLRWTCKSTRKLAEELNRQGHSIGATKVGSLLVGLNYSLQANRKTREGSQHADRNAQFQHIARRTKQFQSEQQPVISVDTKKKELIGDFKNGGREWEPTTRPVSVRVHDFIDKELGKAIPYGVYDLFRNEGWVNVGVDHDTAEFAVESIRRWWKKMGHSSYPNATDLFITADAGGSNGHRVRLWKAELQRLANDSGLRIHVSHYPPGTSKWNKIEHRMFCHVTANWRGRPLETLETVVNLIGSTTTKSGLRIRAGLDRQKYPSGLSVTRQEMEAINIKPSRFHGDWNYRIEPQDNGE